MPKKESRLTPETIAYIKRRLLNGEMQHLIAADLRINQGRISEINTGKRGEGIPPAPSA